MPPPTRTLRVLSWILRLLVAAILAQTLFFKFTAAPESVQIFETLGMEPWGRIGSGLAELLAVGLLLVPATVSWGALVALGVIAGAVGAHLTHLGIEVQGDGGLLFGMALLVLFASAALLWLHRRELPLAGRRH